MHGPLVLIHISCQSSPSLRPAKQPEAATGTHMCVGWESERAPLTVWGRTTIQASPVEPDQAPKTELQRRISARTATKHSTQHQAGTVVLDLRHLRLPRTLQFPYLTGAISSRTAPRLASSIATPRRGPLLTLPRPLQIKDTPWLLRLSGR